MIPSATQDASTPQVPQERRPSATVVPFRAPATRRFRRAEETEAPRGAVLLFTGVRYERWSEPEADAALPQRRWS